jgi:hypothetical protein
MPGESFWPEYLAHRELAARRKRAAHLRLYDADDSIVFGVDPATEVVVVLSRFDGGWVEVLDTHVPETKPEAMWEGGDWLFHVAQGI